MHGEQNSKRDVTFAASIAHAIHHAILSSASMPYFLFPHFFSDAALDMTINLGRGWPDPDLLPPLSSLLEGDGTEKQKLDALQYGEDQGNESFREVISQRLRHGATNVRSENILITNGSSQGLDLICKRFCQPGDYILLEDLSYFYVRGIFEQHGLVQLRIPHSTITTTTNNNTLETNGSLMDLVALEEMLEEIKVNNDRPLPKLLYTVPVCHNPTGSTMSEQSARRLIDIARRFQILIVSDEVYLLLAFNCPTPPRSLLEYDEDQETVLAINSFSKLLGPGLRLGWIEASPKHVKFLEKTGYIQSGGGLNPFTSTIVEGFIRRGEQLEHINHLNNVYQRRCRHMSSCLEEVLGAESVSIEQIMKPHLKQISYVRVTGGFFLWLRLPSSWDVDAESLLEYCKNMPEPVSFFPGHKFVIGESMRPASRNKH